MRKVIFLALMAIFAVGISAQTTGFDLSDYGVSIKPDKRLIAVMASLEAADVNTPLTQSGEEFRTKVKNDLASLSPELRQKIKLFVNQFKKRHPNYSSSEAVAPFVSLAYSLSEAPEMKAPERSLDLPDDLLEVLDYAPLVQEFHKSPGMAAKIDSYFNEHKKTAANLTPSTIEMVREVLDYLHTKPELTYVERVSVEPTAEQKKKKIKAFKISENERNFTIVPAILASKGTINFLNIGDRYFAIIPPDTNVRSSEVRRGFVQFVIDPLVLKNARSISPHSDEIKKLLEARRDAGALVSPDVFLAVSRSLVAAVDTREEEYRKTRIATAQARRKINSLSDEAAQKEVADELARFKQALADDAALELSESYEKGAVLSFYFAEKLRGLEDSGFDIGNFLKDWIVSFNPKNEKDRLDQFAEARSRALEKRTAGVVIETTLITNPVTQELDRIDNFTKQKNYPQAQTELKALLNKYPNESARIYYSMGRVASLSAEALTDRDEINKRLIEAKVFYENVLRSASPADDPGLISSTYFALGRIFEFYNQKDYALKIYETAIKIGRVEGGAYIEAVDARQKLIEKKN